MFNLEKFKLEPLTTSVRLEVIYIPAMDDGYGSWKRGDGSHVVGKDLDDPALADNLRTKVNEILADKEVKVGLQKPIFRLHVVSEKTTSVNVLQGISLG